MKTYLSASIPLALLAVGARSQSIDPATTIIVSVPGDYTTTQYYEYCSTATNEITVTGTSTLTYCPGLNCNGQPTRVPPPQRAYTTIYTTVYSQWCPTGLAPVTYTISEVCPCESIGQPGYLPSGYTTTVDTCTTCGSDTLTATLTIPITGPTNVQGAPNVGPAPTAPAGGYGPAGGNGSAPARYASSVAAGGGAGPAGPAGPATTGPETPDYTGAASTMSTQGLLLSSLAVIAGSLALML